MLKPIHQRTADNFLRGMSGVVRTIYQAIPLSEAWTPQEVLGELHRTGNKGLGLQQIAGTTKLLKQAGLIKEVRAGGFTRYPTKENKPRTVKAVEPKPVQQPESEKQTMINHANNTSKAIAHIVGLAGDLRTMGARLSAMGAEIDALASELQEEIDTMPIVTPEITAKLAKLDQFANLMKGMI